MIEKNYEKYECFMSILTKISCLNWSLNFHSWNFAGRQSCSKLPLLTHQPPFFSYGGQLLKKIFGWLKKSDYSCFYCILNISTADKFQTRAYKACYHANSEPPLKQLLTFTFFLSAAMIKLFSWSANGDDGALPRSSLVDDTYQCETVIVSFFRLKTRSEH